MGAALARLLAHYIDICQYRGEAMESLDAMIIGGGQAGLAAAYHMQRANRSCVILEAAEQPGGSWPHYYASLRLFSPARFSSLPGLPFPGDPERYPTRDEVIAYLRSYAAHFRLPIVTSAKVEEVTRDGGLFVARTAGGKVFHARTLIAATGSFHTPHLPELPGQELFEGTSLHSFAYRDPSPFRGQRVVVVGAGNSAVQIGAELAQVAQVSLATHAPVRFIPQRPLGRDIHFWWRLARLDTSAIDQPIGAIFRRLVGSRGAAVLDAGRYQAALSAAAPDQRRMFERFHAHGVVWADGATERVDAVIFATGYRPNLGYLAPLGALDAEGQALHRNGVSLTVPGLGFVGLTNQRTFASATLRGVGADAAIVVRALLPASSSSQTLPARRLLGRLPCCPQPSSRV
jgi:putative flavoprotein involved in K+ transport